MKTAKEEYNEAYSRLRLYGRHETDVNVWVSFYYCTRKIVHQAVMETWYNKKYKFNGWYNQSRREQFWDKIIPF